MINDIKYIIIRNTLYRMFSYPDTHPELTDVDQDNIGCHKLASPDRSSKSSKI